MRVVGTTTVFPLIEGIAALALAMTVGPLRLLQPMLVDQKCIDVDISKNIKRCRNLNRPGVIKNLLIKKYQSPVAARPAYFETRTYKQAQKNADSRV